MTMTPTTSTRTSPYSQLRDTQFGHLVRFLSGYKYLRYPDEVDPSLWRKAMARDDTIKPNMQSDEREKPVDTTDQTTNASSANNLNSGDGDGARTSQGHFVEDGKDVHLVDWYGPDDPENPQNWSSNWKLLVTLQICVLNFAFYIASSIYVPGEPSIMAEFGVSETVATLGLSLFTLGYGTGPMFLSPLSEMPTIGRSGIYFWTFLFFVLLQLPTGYAVNMPMFLVFRYITGFLGSPALATGGATIADIRAKRLRKATGNKRLKSQSEIDAAHHTLRDDLVVLGRAFTLTFFEPIVFLWDLYTALLYGVLFTWFESFPLVFGGVYGFDTQEQGLVFLGIFVGGLVTLPLFMLWIRHGIVPKFTQPTFKPEMVLPPAFFGAASLPVCLFWYGWSARKSVHWMVPIVGSSFFAVGIITLFNPVMTYLGIAYPKYAASIFAGNALFRASFGAIFPLFARQLFQRLGIGPGNSLLAGIAVCFMPLPYIFYKNGVKIRHMSRNARHDV
ncbi:hypothetical protein PV11_01442 [Exophiala sideris]|uniref:Major facilitator superfamily (MFS) profile domain-containing protein n=1 Tax=Exophiala sideris TaxID=1016849 RepID=A0A0D1YW54_9EURO|nr:hypothetical protein PV11_01442 [Exophiala sideris]